MNYSTSSAQAESVTLETNNSTNDNSLPDASKARLSPSHSHSQPLTRNKNLLKWVEKMAALTQPAAIHWVDGSQAEYETLCAQMVASGTFIKLNESCGPAVITPNRTRVMSPVWRTAHTSVRFPRMAQALQTIGSTPPRCARNSRRSSRAACADAPCMCCLFPWDQSARPCLRSASSLPIRRMR
jgi:hypothetical protein